ncbi:HAD-like domain-containing protein [Gloeopeniophorella convolvens]|nr:HAD-like domain-containing protein [Gloeopeniophorella convolvens]
MTSRPAIRALLIDLSGTIHVAAQPTSGSPRAIQRLRGSSIPFRFCSNASKESTNALRGKLAQMGIETRDGEVWTSVSAVHSALREKGVKRPLVLASESAAEECRRGIPDDPTLPYDSVVVAFAPAQFDYAALNAAFRVLMSEHRSQRGHSRLNCPLIATHRSRYIGDSDGALSLGPGPFVAALENASGRNAEIVGKPERRFFELVLNSLESETQGRDGVVAIIGDDVQSDLGGGAVDLGFWRVLVRSGKYREGDETREGVKQPDEICDSFASFVENFLGE